MKSKIKDTATRCEKQRYRAMNSYRRNPVSNPNVKKRKRCDEPRGSDIITPFQDGRKDYVTKDSDSDHRVIAPTMRGLAKAAQIIRCGQEVVSIPTEKNYCFASFVPFQTPVQSPFKVDVPQKPHWYERYSNCFGKSVLLHHPVQAYNFISFTTPKSFVFRQRASSGESSNGDKTLMAVKFSESHEVLCRLSSSFWPGTTTIYAPVRTRRLKRTIKFSDSAARSSSESLGSLASEDSQCDDDTLQSFPSIPVIPDSILLSSEQLHIPIDDNEGAASFVGMRCPSHPISRRVLSEAYGQIEEKKPSRLKGAIVAVDNFDSIGASSGKEQNLVSCGHVCKNTRSSDAYGDVDKCAVKRPILNVINGENNYEAFYVPPCNFSKLSSVSLVIDAPRRTIILLRHKQQNSRKKTVACDSKFEVKVEDVVRALCPAQPEDIESIKSSTIAAVMCKWMVVEKEI